MARGDQIYVLREWWNVPGIYEHHGIDCGDGTVVHYRKPSNTVERTAWSVFTQGQPIRRKDYPTAYIPDVVVQRALSRLGEQEYNLLFNNCEHFATWCKTGVNYSQQVKDFIPWLATANPEQFEIPVDEALKGKEYTEAKRLLDTALAQIKVVWDDTQPRYVKAQQEVAAWERVAQAALAKNREDLARGAIAQKLKYHRQAQALEAQLQKLATMTETLLRNSLHLQA